VVLGEGEFVAGEKQFLEEEGVGVQGGTAWGDRYMSARR
jgi:hypothetical protein